MSWNRRKERMSLMCVENFFSYLLGFSKSDIEEGKR